MFFQQSRIQKRKVQQDQDQVFFNHEKEMNAYLVCNEFCLFFLFSILLPYKFNFTFSDLSEVFWKTVHLWRIKNGRQIFLEL